MPSFWNRMGLAVAFMFPLSSGPVSSFAQSPSCSTIPIHPRPCVESPGSTHVGPPAAPSDTPPDAGRLDPADIPAPPDEPVPPDTPMPPDTPTPPESPMPLDPSTPPDTPMPDLAFSAPEAGFGSPDVAFNAPNMMGDLLRAYRGVEFSYLQAGDFAVTSTAGAVNFRNSKVAENNSAIPRDRVSFRYNYFKNSIQVRGLARSPEMGQPFTISSNGETKTFQFNNVQPASRDVDVHLYTLGLEKTFLDGIASVEVRVPFARTLDSNLDLVSGVPVPSFDGVVPAVQPTPGQTLGDTDTELQDTNLILKAILAQDPGQRWTVSGGLGVVIPTGRDVDVRVVDYNDDNFLTLFGATTDPGELVDADSNEALRRVLAGQFAFDQRSRNFRIENETWGLSPFLAAVAMPTDRSFVNAFFQIDVPVNSSDWSFSETDVDLEQQEFIRAFGPQGRNPALQSANSASGSIEDQTLMHIDIGGGYWLYQNPYAKTLKGVAGLLELHYTTTLEDADIAVVPETPITTGLGDSPLNRVGPLSQPRLGNIANRVDILNLTVGSQFVLGRHATLAAGYVAPLRNDLDRTFDGEANVQLNLYR